MLLREIAHARSGDKGDTAQLSVIAYREHDYPLLVEILTAERVKTHFGAIVGGPVTRIELPHLGALLFVMEQALGGGVTRSVALDPHGKTLASTLLGLLLPAEGAHQ